MRTLLLLIVLGLTSPCLLGQSMPELGTVVEAFFEQKPVDERMFYALGFEHRPDGYYAVYKENGIEIADRVLFYDITTPSIGFENVGLFYDYFEGYDGPQRADIEELAKAYLRHLGKATTDAFARQPYYGYEGWYQDAIAFFKEKEELNDDELHSLARAQSVAAASLLGNNRGYSIESERFDLPMGQNSLTDMQLINYRERADECLASYRKLKERSPEYLTPVGTAAIKYANEIVDVFLTLLYYQNPITAMDVLEENIYPEHLLRNARNLLNSCPPNAVLITYGDNDTYPLYYLQAMGSLRKDVLIANSSLLILSRYRLMLQGEPLWTEPVQTRLPANHYEEEIVYWGKGSGATDTLSMETIYQQLQRTENYYQRIFTLSGSAIAIPVPRDAKTVVAKEAPDELIWQAGGKKTFIFPAEFFVADVLSTHRWQRPVCFTNTVAAPVLKPWQKHLAREGLVYRLYPETFAGQITDFKTTEINLDYSLDFWYKHMAFDTSTAISTLDQLSFYTSNLLTATALATRLSQLGKSDEVLGFCQYLMEKYPNHVKAWDSNWTYILEVLIKEDDQVLAKKLYDVLLANIKAERIHMENESKRNRLSAKLQQIGFAQGWD